MRARKFAGISVFLLLICLPCARAEQVDWEIANLEKVANPPNSVLLEYRFVDNEVRRYDVTLAGEGAMKLPGQTQQAKLQANSEMTFTEQVVPTNSSAEFWHIRRKLIKGEMTIPDFGKMPVEAPQLDMEVDKSGTVRVIHGLDQLPSTFGLPPDQAMTDILSQLKFPGFPKKELRVNDKWEDEFKIQLAGQEAIPIRVVSTLVGFDRVQKTDCATILTTYEAPFSFSLDAKDEQGADAKQSTESAAPAKKPTALVGKEKGEFHTYFSFTDGKIVQSYGTIELTADIDAKADEPEQKPAAGTAASDTPKHDLDVKYYVTSTLNPKPVEDAKQAQKARTK